VIEKIGHIKNPLTVISMFAGIAEISGTLILPFIEANNQHTYIWFLMIFPTLLVVIFFLTLNFNHEVLYAPSDYRNENNFLRSLREITHKEKQEKLSEEVEEANREIVVNQPGNDNQENVILENKEVEYNDLSHANEIKSQNHDKSNFKNHNDTYTSIFNDKKNSNVNSELMDMVALAEKLSILKLSKDLSVEFKSGLTVKTSASQDVMFDALAVDNHKIQVAEIKYSKFGRVSLSALKNVVLKAELMMSSWPHLARKDFILHFVLTIDEPSGDIDAIKSRIENIFYNHAITIKVHVYNMKDLINEWQCPQ
jgi:hypothetical protein